MIFIGVLFVWFLRQKKSTNVLILIYMYSQWKYTAIESNVWLATNCYFD